MVCCCAEMYFFLILFDCSGARMLELLTDAEKEKMTAAGEEFYTEYFAEGEDDGDFHAETGWFAP